MFLGLNIFTFAGDIPMKSKHVTNVPDCPWCSLCIPAVWARRQRAAWQANLRLTTKETNQRNNTILLGILWYS
jgi:hypothetical protein